MLPLDTHLSESLLELPDGILTALWPDAIRRRPVRDAARRPSLGVAVGLAATDARGVHGRPARNARNLAPDTAHHPSLGVAARIYLGAVPRTIASIVLASPEIVGGVDDGRDTLLC